MVEALLIMVYITVINYGIAYYKFRHDQELGALINRLETLELTEYRAIYLRKGQPIVFRAKNLVEAVTKAKEYGAAQKLTYSHIIRVL